MKAKDYIVTGLYSTHLKSRCGIWSNGINSSDVEELHNVS